MRKRRTNNILIRKIHEEHAVKKKHQWTKIDVHTTEHNKFSKLIKMVTTLQAHQRH